MMSLTALRLRNIDPATDQRVPKLQSTKVEAMAEIEVRRAKAEADDDATRLLWCLAVEVRGFGNEIDFVWLAYIIKIVIYIWSFESAPL